MIKKVRIGAQYEGKVYDFWIDAELLSGTQIKIFDNEPFDLRNYENQKVECLILAFLVEFITGKTDNNDSAKNVSASVDKPFTKRIKGNFNGNYVIPEKWKSYSNKISPAIQNSDGVFLLEDSEVKGKNLKENETITLYVDRFDLLEWYPID